MTNTSKNNKKMVILDFTDVYNAIKAEEERDLAEAAAYTSIHQSEIKPITKTSLWQKIKNLFKRKK